MMPLYLLLERRNDKIACREWKVRFCKTGLTYNFPGLVALEKFLGMKHGRTTAISRDGKTWKSWSSFKKYIRRGMTSASAFRKAKSVFSKRG